MPALKAGLLGASLALRGQLPPFGEVVVSKLSTGWASAPSGALQGVRSEVVVYWPQVGGEVSDAPGPLKRCRSMSPSGSSGLSWKLVVS